MVKGNVPLSHPTIVRKNKQNCQLRNKEKKRAWGLTLMALLTITCGGLTFEKTVSVTPQERNTA